MVTRPNLFIVGQPKSGTSALFSFLKQRPEIGVCATKEPQYFCKDLRSQYFYLSNTPRELDNYLSLFSDGAKRYQMEASTAYLFSEVAAEELYSFNPQAKIIMMLREPVSFLYTYHRQLLRNSCTFEVEENFSKALALEDARRGGKDLPAKVFEAKFLMYSDRVKYVDHILRFAKLFDKDQIKIIIYDDFERNNRDVFLDVLEFLGLESDVLPEFGVVNKQVAVRNRVVKQFVDQRFYPVKSWIKKYLGKEVFNASRSLYRRFIFSQAKIPVLSAVEQEQLKLYYLGEVRRLSAYLGRDLVTEWGYAGIIQADGREAEERSAEKLSSIS